MSSVSRGQRATTEDEFGNTIWAEPAVAEAVTEVLKKAGTRAVVEAGPARARVTHQLATKITPSRPQWLWERWLLLRALNLLTGRQGSGKTTFAAHLVAATSAGIPLPGDIGRAPITCAILSLEEPPDRVVARLHAAGADLERVHVLGDVEDHDDEGNPYRRRWSLPRDISILGKVIEELTIAFVVIDGLGYSIAGDSHNYTIVGSALARAGRRSRTYRRRGSRPGPSAQRRERPSHGRHRVDGLDSDPAYLDRSRRRPE